MGFLGSLFKKKAPKPERAAPQTLSWRVTSVTRETPSSVSFEVDATMDFKAGQFVLLRPTPQLPWRAYSFSRGPGQPLRLTVKAVAGGQVSPHLTSKLAVGDVLEVKGPYGQFVLPAGFQRALFIAGGSGITPFLSMLQDEQKKGWPSAITLLDFNRTQAEQILRAELDAFVAASGGKLEVVHVLDDAANAAGQKGPPMQELFGALLEGRPAPDVIAMCGPEPMMDLARKVVDARFAGVKVLEEKFSMSHDGDPSGATHTVELVQGSKTQSFPVKSGEHVLAAARKAGIALSAGCEMGACGVCRVKVLDGAIEVPDDACLSDGEKSDGYALVCVGTVKGHCRIQPAP
ncbi:MAG: 2Fe-2S iron-sulfur cluster-binding protein [Myxococcota bacterium]